jgi:hypothetical protein
MLMPSTPSAYPQVVSRTFASLIPAFTQLKSIFAPGSIPGSSTKKATGQSHKLWPVFFSSTSLGLPGENASVRIEKCSAIVGSRR